MKLNVLLTLLLTSSLSYPLTVDMIDLETNNKIGIVEIKENKYGVEFSPNLKGLPPGLHGFHVHGDNHSDIPSPLGGGGERIAAGVIPSN